MWRRTRKPGLNQDENRVREIGVDERQSGIVAIVPEEVGAHGDEVLGAAGRAIEPAEQFLPARFGQIMQSRRGGCVRIAAIGCDSLVELAMVGAEITRQRREEFGAGRFRKSRIGIERLTGDQCAGRLAAPRQQRLAEREDVCGRHGRFAERPDATIEQIAPAFGDARQKVGKECIGHEGSLRDRPWRPSFPPAIEGGTHSRSPCSRIGRSSDRLRFRQCQT